MNESIVVKNFLEIFEQKYGVAGRSGRKPGSGKKKDDGYKMLSPRAKEKVLKDKLAKYKEKYVPKEKQAKKISTLSPQNQKLWKKRNADIGTFEGMWKAFANKGWASKGTERRKYFRMAISIGEKATALAKRQKEFWQ